MGGPYIAVIVSLLSLALTSLNIARDVFWSGSKVPDWYGMGASIVGVGAVTAAIAVILVSSGRAPRWISGPLRSLLAPADTRPFPDLALTDVVARVCPTMGGDWKLEDVRSGEHARLDGLLVQLREHGRLGRLTIWGRPKTQEGSDDRAPREEIPADFWTDGHLDYLEYVRDSRGKAERRPYGRDPEWYRDIWFNEAQVRRLYARGSRYKLRLPWERAW